MLDNEDEEFQVSHARPEPDLGAMLGFAGPAPVHTPQEPQARFVTVAQAQAEASGQPYMQRPAVTVEQYQPPVQHQVPPPVQHVQQVPAHVQQALVVASAAAPFNALFGVAEHDTPREYAEALAIEATAVMVGGDVENALGVAAGIIAERLQSVHDVDKYKAYELTQHTLVTACAAMISDILDRKVFKGTVAAQMEYRRDLILRAVKYIQLKNQAEGITGVTVSNVLNRIGRKRWSVEDVQLIMDDLINSNLITALPPEPKPGRKSVRYILNSQ